MATWLLGCRAAWLPSCTVACPLGWLANWLAGRPAGQPTGWPLPQAETRFCDFVKECHCQYG
eukprot:6143736-Heterocapsa_arctica.AAC.1